MALPLGRPTVRTLWCGGLVRGPGWLLAGSCLDLMTDHPREGQYAYAQRNSDGCATHPVRERHGSDG